MREGGREKEGKQQKGVKKGVETKKRADGVRYSKLA